MLCDNFLPVFKRRKSVQGPYNVRSTDNSDVYNIIKYQMHRSETNEPKSNRRPRAKPSRQLAMYRRRVRYYIV